jgi:hypothetical protein
MKMHGGMEVQLHAFPTLALGGEWSVTHLPLLPRGKNTRYPVDTRSSGQQSQTVHGSEEKNPFPGSTGNRFPVVQLAAQSLY